MMKLVKPEFHAVNQFIVNCTVPIIYEATQLPRGTGTFFKIGNRSFLITASHIFDDGVKPESLGFPLQARKAEMISLGKATIFRPKEKNIDVAAIELNCDWSVPLLQAGWHFMGVDNIAFENVPSSSYIVCGFPMAISKPVDDIIYAPPLTFITYPLASVPSNAKDPVDPNYDKFLIYSKVAECIDGSEINTTELYGVSGASIWAVNEYSQATNVWTPEAAVKIVGIQSAFLHSEYVRYKSWTALAVLFNEIDAELGVMVQKVGSVK